MEIEKIDEFEEIINKYENIMLVGHVNPDGDCIGSLMGMYSYLTQINKNVMPVVPNMYPNFLSFLDTEGAVVVYATNENRVEEFLNNSPLVICMDLNGLKRVDELGRLIESRELELVLVDHHLYPEPIFKVAISYPTASSTCEIAYYIIRGLNNFSHLSYECAAALYTGMMTDTNNFSNSVTPYTFKMAGELIAMGVDKELIQSKVLSSFSENRMRLMGYMLYNNLKVLEPYHAAFMILSDEVKESFAFERGDNEGFVNLPLSMQDVELSAFFTQDKEFIKVSLRSKSTFSANRFAMEYFNGGGHERASGGKIKMPLERVEEYFINSLKEFIVKEG